MHHSKVVLNACSLVMGDIHFIKGRARGMMEKRHIVRYMLKEYTTLSLQGIGNETNCSHANVLNSIKRTTQWYSTLPHFKSYCDTIEEFLDKNEHSIVIGEIEYKISSDKLIKINQILWD